MRAQDEIRAVRNSMKNELEALPEYSVFGDSNAGDIADLKSWLGDIDRVLRGKKPITKAVESFINGTDDWFLGDYLE